MREALMASGLLHGLALLLSLAVFLTGIVVVIRGKFTIFGHALRGGPARIAGWYLIAQFAVGLAIDYLLFSSLKLGSSGTPLGERVVGDSVVGVALLLVTIGGIALVRSTARSRGERVIAQQQGEIVQPEAAQRHHGCLKALLILMVIAASLSTVLYLVIPNQLAKANPGAPMWAPAGIRIAGVLAVAMLVALVAIWKWRKWGVYLFALMALFVVVLNFMLLGPTNAVLGLIGPGLLLAFVFREWRLYH